MRLLIKRCAIGVYIYIHTYISWIIHEKINFLNNSWFFIKSLPFRKFIITHHMSFYQWSHGVLSIITRPFTCYWTLFYELSHIFWSNIFFINYDVVLSVIASHCINYHFALSVIFSIIKWRFISYRILFYQLSRIFINYHVLSKIIIL